MAPGARSSSDLSRREIRQAAREAAKRVAEDLLLHISSGPFWSAFSRAGCVIKTLSPRMAELYDVYEAFFLAPTPELP